MLWICSWRVTPSERRRVNCRCWSRCPFEAVNESSTTGCWDTANWVLVFSATFLAALIARRLSSSAGAFAVLLWVAGVVVLAAMDAGSCDCAEVARGLHRVAPYLVFALLPAPARAGAAGHPMRWSRQPPCTWVAAIVATNTTGGKSLGPRLPCCRSLPSRR